MTAHIETLMKAWATDAFPDVRVCTELPADLAGSVPLIQIVGIGGTGDRYHFDSPRVDFDCFAGTRDSARDLAQSLMDALLTGLPGETLDGGSFVLGVELFTSPNWAPYENTDVRRFVLSAQIRIHTRSAS